MFCDVFLSKFEGCDYYCESIAERRLLGKMKITETRE